MALGWLWWRAWVPGGAGTPRRFAWQAWHFVTWELYAGSARLTKACQDVGVRSVAVDKDPNRSHGTKIFSCDVTQPGELETLRTFLRAEKDSLAWVPRLLACQAWHFVTSTFTLCGRRGSRYSSQTTCPTYMHTYMHTYIHNTHTYIHTTHLVHTQLAHTYSSTHNLLHINPSPSLLSFPAFPMPSLPFFCCLLEEVDMWGYPVL